MINENWTPKQVINFVGFQFDLEEGKARPTLEHWQILDANPEPSLQSHLPLPAVVVPDRVTNSYRETSPPRLNL